MNSVQTSHVTCKNWGRRRRRRRNPPSSLGSKRRRAGKRRRRRLYPPDAPSLRVSHLEVVLTYIPNWWNLEYVRLFLRIFQSGGILDI